MKIRRPSALSARLGLFIAIATGLAAGSAAYGQALDGVRVVDIKYLLDNHPRFQAAMASLKTEFEATARRIQDDHDAIIKLEQQLKNYNEGTPDYNQLYDQVSHKKAEWTVQADKQRKEFRNREMELLSNVYYEIQMAVTSYCEHENIGLVIQYNGDPVDRTKLDQVVKAMSKPLVYVAKNRDITPIIRDMITHGYTARRAEPPQGVLGPPR